MTRRPTSITIIAWFLFITSILGLGSMAFTMNSDNPQVQEILNKNPIPLSMMYAMAVLGSIVSIVSGIGMLKGLNWARWLYVGWSLFGFIFGLITSPMKLMLLPGLLLFAVIAFFLFRPQATKFFTQSVQYDAEPI